MKTLVTGATGFIGSAVVRKLLARGKDVRCYVEPGASTAALDGLDVEIVQGDVCDRDRIGSALDGCDVLYHLAAIYRLWLPDPRLMYEVNVEGTKTVLFAAMEAGVRRFVHTSSIAAVGWPRDGELADETTEFNLGDEANDYILSKWLSERDALRFAREGLPVVVVNPAFPFGERDSGPTPTGQFIIETLRGRVPGYTSGGFNAVDVDDVAEGHVLAEERGRVGERYILGGHNVSFADFFRTIAELGGVKPPARRLPDRLYWAVGWALESYADRVSRQPPLITYKAARYASRTLHFDCAKARRELGLPQTPLAESVERAIRWFRAHEYA